MTNSHSSRQVSRKLQSLCLNALPLWQKHRTYGLYRCTEDFVQWLIFDSSAYTASVRVQYAIQPLAVQFPAEALTIGDMIRNTDSGELRVDQLQLDENNYKIVQNIIEQVAPSATLAFTIEDVVEYLNHYSKDHVAVLIAQGIAIIAFGEAQQGREIFQVAYDWYQRIDTAWAHIEELRVLSWLNTPDNELISLLRRDAAVGKALLHLK